VSISTVSRKPATIRAEGGKTRRVALAASIAVGPFAMPAIGAITDSFVDPTFRAIPSRRAAYDAALALRFAIDDLINNSAALEVTAANWYAYDRAIASEDATFDDLLSCARQTLAGIRATIAHLIYLDDGRITEKMRRLPSPLLQSAVLPR
jgi:hypothetical protein